VPRLYDSRKRVLVTGGAGFVGSHLIDRLLEQGHEVICADNLFTGTKRNIEHLHNHARFEFLRHDVTFPLYIEADEIYNLACPASPVHYQHDPVQTTKTSVHGAINMLGLAKRLRCKIFQASTSEVYGDPSVHPQTEDYWGNVNPIFNTYGPRMHPSDGRVVSNFIVQALKGEPITLYGDGNQTRSFCYVDDLVEGFIRLMDTPSDVTGPVNLGNPVEFTMRELAELVLAETGSKSKLVNMPLPADDPRQRKPNIDLAKAKLDWEPKVPLREGLKSTVAYFRNLR
jgi:UDP-glucuronate decarboxylase